MQSISVMPEPGGHWPCRNRGEGAGGTRAPQYLADQFTLFQPGEDRLCSPITTGPPKFFHLPASLYFKRGGCRTLCAGPANPPLAVIGGSMFDSVAKNLIKQTVTQQNLCAALLDLIFIIIEFCNRNWKMSFSVSSLKSKRGPRGDSFNVTLKFNGILLPKLFWPTVRKNCSSDCEKLLNLQNFWDH